MDFKVQDCNCRDPRGMGKCQYEGTCRVLIIIYKITCKRWRIRSTSETSNKLQEKNDRPPPGCQETHGEMSTLRLLCQKLCRHLAERSCSTIARNAAGPHRMQHSMTKQPNIGSQNLWQVYLCSVQQKKDGNCQTFSNNPRQIDQLLFQTSWSMPTQTKGTIGITNRRKPPVLMSARNTKKLSWRLQTHLEEE
jgi:hypothetical protein